MKTTFFCSIIFFLFLSIDVSAQVNKSQSVSIGYDNRINYPDKSYFSKYYKPKNMTGSFRMGYAIPIGLLGQPPSIGEAISSPYLGYDGFGMKPGYMFALDGYANFTPNSRKIWLKMPWSISSTIGLKPDWSIINSNIDFDPFSFMGFGTGIMLNSSFNDVFAISLYYKLNLMLILSLPTFTLESLDNTTMSVFLTRQDGFGEDPLSYCHVIGGEIQFLHNWSIFAEFSSALVKARFDGEYGNYAPWGTFIPQSYGSIRGRFPYSTLTVGLSLIFNKKTIL